MSYNRHSWNEMSVVRLKTFTTKIIEDEHRYVQFKDTIKFLNFIWITVPQNCMVSWYRCAKLFTLLYWCIDVYQMVTCIFMLLFTLALSQFPSISILCMLSFPEPSPLSKIFSINPLFSRLFSLLQRSLIVFLSYFFCFRYLPSFSSFEPRTSPLLSFLLQLWSAALWFPALSSLWTMN